jgi:hypothetical protein
MMKNAHIRSTGAALMRALAAVASVHSEKKFALGVEPSADGGGFR